MPEILEEVGRRGVSLFPKGDRLRFYPKNALTPELLEEIKEHKAEILVAVGDEPVRSAGEVLEMAHEFFGPSRPFNPDEHPSSKHEFWVDRDKAVASQVLNVLLRALSVELKLREQEEILERVAELDALMEQTQRGRRGA